MGTETQSICEDRRARERLGRCRLFEDERAYVRRAVTDCSILATRASLADSALTGSADATCTWPNCMMW